MISSAGRPPRRRTVAFRLGASWALACICMLWLIPAAHGTTNDVSKLIRQLKDSGKVSVRWKAAYTLGTTKDPRAVEPLIEALKHDPSATVRLNAAEALGRIEDPRAVEPLIEALKDDPEGTVRFDAAEALGEIKDPRAVGPLIAALKDSDGDVRGWAAKALAEMKDPRAFSALLAALSERNAAVIAAAYLFFVDRGEPGSGDALMEALNMSGDLGMAQAFLICGNPKLEQAARDWAAGHGWGIKRTTSGGFAIDTSSKTAAFSRAIAEFQDEMMAQAFLTCRSPTLEQAARVSATSRGYRITSVPGYPPLAGTEVEFVCWGSGLITRR